MNSSNITLETRKARGIKQRIDSYIFIHRHFIKMLKVDKPSSPDTARDMKLQAHYLNLLADRAVNALLTINRDLTAYRGYGSLTISQAFNGIADLLNTVDHQNFNQWLHKFEEDTKPHIKTIGSYGQNFLDTLKIKPLNKDINQ